MTNKTSTGPASVDKRIIVFGRVVTMGGRRNDFDIALCVIVQEGLLTVDEKLKAWKLRYDKLLNEEFPWNADSLSNESPVPGPAINISADMVRKAISK